jgi:hypothetical protein
MILDKILFMNNNDFFLLFTNCKKVILKRSLLNEQFFTIYQQYLGEPVFITDYPQVKLIINVEESTFNASYLDK